MLEEPLRFGRRGALVGIVTSPSLTEGPLSSSTGVIFLNAGLMHRIGPNRLFVTMARRLADLGAFTLRFDHSGIGDSEPRSDNLSFEKASVIETQEAMNFLSRKKGCDRFVVVGLCSGTLTAFRAACSDARISGLVLLNALLEHSDSISEELANKVVNRKIARSYWTDKMFRPQSWAKLLGGGVNLGKIIRVTGSALSSTLIAPAKQPPGVTRVVEDLAALIGRDVGILFIFGENTTFREYFRLTLEEDVDNLSRTGDVQLRVLQHADHTFTRLRHQKRVLSLAEEWIGAQAGSRATPTRTTG